MMDIRYATKEDAAAVAAVEAACFPPARVCGNFVAARH